MLLHYSRCYQFVSISPFSHTVLFIHHFWKSVFCSHSAHIVVCLLSNVDDWLPWSSSSPLLPPSLPLSLLSPLLPFFILYLLFPPPPFFSSLFLPPPPFSFLLFSFLFQLSPSLVIRRFFSFNIYSIKWQQQCWMFRSVDQLSAE